jgi:ketosteroid isomerase-like protein
MDNPGQREWPTEDVAASNRSFQAAILAHDLDAAADAYSADAKLVAPSADFFEGRTAIAEFWRAGVDAGVAEATFDPLKLERSDGVAFEIGHYTLRLRPSNSDEVFDRGSYVLVHRREPDGKWRRVIEMLSPDVR